MTGRERHARKRNIVSFGLTFGIYALALLVLWMAGLLHFEQVSDQAGAIEINLGRLEGIDNSQERQVEEAPAPAEEQPEPEQTNPEPQVAQEPEEAQVATLATVPATTVAKTRKTSTTLPRRTQSTQASRPVGTVPQPRNDTTSRVAANPRGNDKGNEWVLDTGGAEAGVIGRFELTEYLPVPERIGAHIWTRIENKRKQEGRFADLAWYYQENEQGDFSLAKKPVPTSARISIWQLLNEAQLFQNQTDFYRDIRRPVSFIISVGVGGGKPLSVERQQSSGSNEADEAILTGLRSSSFSNSSSRSVTMRFTYTFR